MDIIPEALTLQLLSGLSFQNSVPQAQYLAAAPGAKSVLPPPIPPLGLGPAGRVQASLGPRAAFNFAAPTTGS